MWKSFYKLDLRLYFLPLDLSFSKWKANFFFSINKRFKARLTLVSLFIYIDGIFFEYIFGKEKTNWLYK